MRQTLLAWVTLILASPLLHLGVGALNQWEEELKADLLFNWFDEGNDGGEQGLMQAYEESGGFTLTSLAKRQRPGIPGYPPGDYTNGWQSMPAMTDADGYLVQKWEAEGGSIPLYRANRTPSEVTRAVVIPPGMMRDCWYYYRTIQSGLVAAAKNDTTIKEKEIDVMSPCFMGFMDLNAGGAVKGNFVWNRTTWVSGQYNVNDDWNDNTVPTKVSSYKLLDAIVDSYMDKKVYPNLKAVVIAGHSAGAQMVQRYLMLRTTTKHDERLQFWIGNPSSFVWLDPARPRANSTCTGTDNWKYGLTDKVVGYGTAQWERLGRSGLVARYLTRYAHYIWGTADNMAGDLRCQACTQGTSHYSRGANFAANLYKAAGNKNPVNTTIQYLDVWHDVDAIVHQAAGWQYLFKWLPTSGPPPPSPTKPPTNPDSGGGGGFPGFPGFPGMPACPAMTTAPAPPPPGGPGNPPPSGTTTSTAPQATQTKYGQCGGTGWNGPTACAAGSTCKDVSPPYYSQCL